MSLSLSVCVEGGGFHFVCMQQVVLHICTAYSRQQALHYISGFIVNSAPVSRYGKGVLATVYLRGAEIDDTDGVNMFSWPSRTVKLHRLDIVCAGTSEYTA
jgi:hypothetical protein